MSKYSITNKAVEDLSKIWDYTYEVWYENQADKYYFELLEDCQVLAKNHDLGKKYEKVPLTSVLSLRYAGGAKKFSK